MKRAALACLLLALAAGCGAGSAGQPTRLTFTALNSSVGTAIFHLDCGPAGGDVADAAAACAALHRDPTLVTSPTQFTCIGGPSSWFDVTISGRLDGKVVQQKFSTCWTPQSATLGRLGLARTLQQHLRTPRHGRLIAGQTRTFPPGALRPGDFLTCRIAGHDLRLGVPAAAGTLGSMGYGGKSVAGATLSGTRHANGSVTAYCRRGQP